MIFRTLYKDYAGKDVMEHFQLHRDAELWASEHGVKIRYGEAYIYANVYELETEEDALAFTLKFGELMK